MTSGTYGEIRYQAAVAAWKTIRHLLYPDTVHLLSPKDIGDAITAASDILAPAEHDAMTRLPSVLQELNDLHREYLQVRDERDEALHAADRLAYAVAALTGENIGKHGPRQDPWQRAMQIIDAIAEANHRPRPSEYGKVA